MKLINEKEVEEAAEMYSLIDEDWINQGNRLIGFCAGVSFAESKIIPLMIEFALWWSKNVKYSEIPHHYCIKGQHSTCYKKEQIFEQFLKSR